jgi:hypothetical protein
MMMRIIPILLILLLASCKSKVVKVSSPENNREIITSYSDDTVYVHFQGGFSGDSVYLFHGNVKLYSEIIRTNDLLGYASEIKVPFSAIKDNIKVVLKKGEGEYSNVILTDSLSSNFVSIWFYNQLNISYQDTPFDYE